MAVPVRGKSARTASEKDGGRYVTNPVERELCPRPRGRRWSKKRSLKNREKGGTKSFLFRHAPVFSSSPVGVFVKTLGVLPGPCRPMRRYTE